MNTKLHQTTEASPIAEADIETELREPLKYNVVLLNDDYTPMDFVIEVLMRLFKKDYVNAYNIMMQVHEQGQGVAGTYSKEIAEEKKTQVADAADANEFPLRCIIQQS